MGKETLYAVIQRGKIVGGKQEIHQTLINASKIPSLVNHLPSYKVLKEHIQNEKVRITTAEANDEIAGRKKGVHMPQPYAVYIEPNEFEGIITTMRKKQPDHPKDHIALVVSGTSMVPVCLILPKK